MDSSLGWSPHLEPIEMPAEALQFKKEHGEIVDRIKVSCGVFSKFTNLYCNYCLWAPYHWAYYCKTYYKDPFSGLTKEGTLVTLWKKE